MPIYGACRLLSDKFILFSGGFDGSSTATTEIFANGAFTAGPTMPTKLWNHCAIKINDTHSIQTGGLDNVWQRKKVRNFIKSLEEIYITNASNKNRPVPTSGFCSAWVVPSDHLIQSLKIITFLFYCLFRISPIEMLKMYVFISCKDNPRPRKREESARNWPS